MAVRRKHIRALVERLLAEHQVTTPPVAADRIARELGLAVVWAPAEDELSGFIFRDKEKDNAIIGVNSNHHPNRQTFTIAHELGHFLLHEVDDVHVDRRFRVWLRDSASSEGTEIDEKEANLFAAELLMPTQLLIQDLKRIRDVDLLDEDVLARLASEYSVSTQAMTFRLAYLGYIQL